MEGTDPSCEDDPLARKVKAWLSEQGYPLEMRAAQIFTRNKIRTIQSEFYYDDDSDTHREIDLLARIPLQNKASMVSSFLCPVIECKSSPGKPWILFSGGVGLSQIAEITQRFVTHGAHSYWEDFARRTRETRHSVNLPLFAIEQDPAYSAVRSSLGKSREDVAYGAMTSVSKAAHAVSNEYSTPGNYTVQIAIPIIVVDSPIFTCKLGADGETLLSKTTAGTIVWRNGVVKSGPPHSIIKIVTESALPGFCSELLATAETIRQDFKEHPWRGPRKAR